MVMRQLGSSATEMQQNIEESVTLAKNAVQLDITDGTSWCEQRIIIYLFTYLLAILGGTAARGFLTFILYFIYLFFCPRA